MDVDDPKVIKNTVLVLARLSQTEARLCMIVAMEAVRLAYGNMLHNCSDPEWRITQDAIDALEPFCIEHAVDAPLQFHGVEHGRIPWVREAARALAKEAFAQTRNEHRRLWKNL